MCDYSASGSLVSYHAIITGPRRIPVPWWRDESRYTIHARKWALRYFNSYPILENFISFKLFYAMVQCIIREAKRLSRNAFVVSISRSTHSDYVWNNLQHIS
jgi:hypothetical protein